MLTLIFLVIAGMFNACMDVVSFHWNVCIFNSLSDQWFDPSKSWKNKWDSSLKKERFFGSSTFLVFLTDFWHLSKFLMILALCFSVVLYTPIVNWYADVLFAYLSYTVSFEIFYSKILSR